MIMKIYFYWCVLLLVSSTSAFVDRALKLGNQDPSSPVPGLSPPDCTYLSTIGVISQGQNALSAASGTAGIYLGTNGPNTFSFINGASVPLILVVWYNPVEDAQSSFMDARTPKITYSLPAQGNAVVVSMDNEVPGGWSTLYNYTTTLTEYGQSAGEHARASDDGGGQGKRVSVGYADLCVHVQ
ncbi:hypothetical protein NEUTE2DRAFT_114996 [Neurospora tetrasperma FGSC 2509]|nr:hypothetical protein NEUTE2DRAFT_114996 [Neurospora tetrasperma FGSC 2509]